MKSVIGMILTYVAVCVFGTLLGAVFYMLYVSCILFVAGTPFAAVSLSAFLHGCILFFPACLLFSSLFLTLYKIRHPEGFLVPFCVYLVLGFVTWTVFFPFSLRIIKMQTVDTMSGKKMLSPGFFRYSGDTVYYFTTVTKNGKASGMGIRLGSSGDVREPVFLFTGMQLEDDSDTPFSDSLAGNVLLMPALLGVMVRNISILYRAALSVSGTGGWIRWLFFASLGLGLLSVYGLVRCTTWRLLNTFLVIFSTVSLCLINSFYYHVPVFFSSAEKILNDWTVKIMPFHIPFIVVVNMFFCLIFSLTGIISILRKDSGRSDE
jgi:hypothetical protein